VFFEQILSPACDAVVAAAWLAAQQQHHAGWDAARAVSLIGRFGLEEHMAKPLYMLSAGSRRKVQLVAAAACGAALTLLDMPFAALDAPSTRVLSALLADAAVGDDRAWVVADYALPPALADVQLATVIDLGD
jgi:ABC-type transport system involved in cytochrome c biogenesis ATPase subunit